MSDFAGPAVATRSDEEGDGHPVGGFPCGSPSWEVGRRETATVRTGWQPGVSPERLAMAHLMLPLPILAVWTMARMVADGIG